MNNITSIRITEKSIPQDYYPLSAHPVAVAVTDAFINGFTRIDVSAPPEALAVSASRAAADDLGINHTMFINVSAPVTSLKTHLSAENITESIFIFMGMETLLFEGMTREESVATVEQMVAEANPKLAVMISHVK